MGERLHSTTPEKRLGYVANSMRLKGTSGIKSRSKRARILKVPLESLRRWELTSGQLARLKGRARTKLRSTQRRFADDLGSELAVYGLFVYRRVYKQRRVRVDWLCAQMRIVVAKSRSIAVGSVKK